MNFLTARQAAATRPTGVEIFNKLGQNMQLINKGLELFKVYLKYDAHQEYYADFIYDEVKHELVHAVGQTIDNLVLNQSWQNWFRHRGHVLYDFQEVQMYTGYAVFSDLQGGLFFSRAGTLNLFPLPSGSLSDDEKSVEELLVKAKHLYPEHGWELIKLKITWSKY